jgi:hypothetical protein
MPGQVKQFRKERRFVGAARHDEVLSPTRPPLREEYPGPQIASTGERTEPGQVEPKRRAKRAKPGAHGQ